MNLFNAKYELDDRPIEEGCQCPACRSYSRAYIRHLLKAKEMLGMRLCVLHNLYFYNTMMEEIREAIEAGEYKAYKKEKTGRYDAISRISFIKIMFISSYFSILKNILEVLEESCV